MSGLLPYVFLGAGFILLTIGIFLYALLFPTGVPFWVWIILIAAFALIVIGLVTNITGQMVSGGYDSSGQPYGYNFYYNRPARPDDPFVMSPDSSKAGPVAITNITY